MHFREFAEQYVASFSVAAEKDTGNWHRMQFRDCITLCVHGHFVFISLGKRIWMAAPQVPQWPNHHHHHHCLGHLLEFTKTTPLHFTFTLQGSATQGGGQGPARLLLWLAWQWGQSITLHKVLWLVLGAGLVPPFAPIQSAHFWCSYIDIQHNASAIRLGWSHLLPHPIDYISGSQPS